MLRSMSIHGKQDLSVKVAEDEKYLGVKTNNFFQEMLYLDVGDLWLTPNGFLLQLTVLLEHLQIISK